MPIAMPALEAGINAAVATRHKRARPIDPAWFEGVPTCSESCVAHDGKRCEILGVRAPLVCSPAVSEISLAFAQTEVFRVDLMVARAEGRLSFEETMQLDVARLVSIAVMEQHGEVFATNVQLLAATDPRVGFEMKVEPDGVRIVRATREVGL